MSGVHRQKTVSTTVVQVRSYMGHALVKHVRGHRFQRVAAELELVSHHAPQGEAHHAGEVHVTGSGGPPFVGSVQLVRRLRMDSRKAPHLFVGWQ